ncbi:MAG: PAS domain-containing protein [Betaproteobacteria bacterium]|nr:PAS domain-containing protein [Betaproteobacteria bacterium]
MPPPSPNPQSVAERQGIANSDEQDAKQQIDAILRDLTERDRMLKTLADNAGRPLLYLDTGHIIRFANVAFLNWVGCDEATAVGSHARRLFGDETYAFYRPYLLRAEAGEICEAETLSKVRAERHIRVAFHPDILDDGRPVGTYVLVQDTEEDFQLRQQLIAKEADLRRLADNIAMPLSRSDRNLRYRYANRVACEWFGVSESDIIGRTWEEVIGTDQFRQVEPHAREALAGREVSYVRRGSFANRPSVMIRVNMFPEVGPSGEVVGLFVTIADVEKDFQVQAVLEERERQLRLITDNIGLPLGYIDARRRIVFANKTSEEWFGDAQGLRLGKTIEELYPPEALETILPHLENAFSGVRSTYERLAELHGRDARWIRGTLIPDRDERGKVRGVYSVLTDIHDDVLMRESLLAQERQLRLFTDNIPESIAYTDGSGTFKFVNNTFLERRGMARHQVIGSHYRDVIPAPELAVDDAFLMRALAGEKVTYERQAATRVGDLRWYRVVLVPDRDREGRQAGLYMLSIDITDIKTAQEALQAREAELRIAMDSLPHPMVYIDASYRYQLINKRVEEMFGLTREQLVNRDLKEVFGERRYSDAKPYWDRAMAGETVTVERQLGTDPATQRWMLTRYTPRFGPDGKAVGLYVAGTDIDDLKKTEISLRHANWLLSSHFENTPLAVIEWDEQLALRRWSPQAERIFGWSESELLGKRIDGWRFTVEGDCEQATAVMERLIKHGDPRASSLHRNYRKDGRVIWCEWYNSCLRDERGQLVSVLSLAQDVTTRVLAEERLVHQATHDSLTGLPNRAMLQDRLRLSISRARRGGQRVAAMFIDLDRFKDVNDTLGHRIGDELLREMAQRLARVVRDTDLLVRLSGDEFMVVLEQIEDLEAPRVVASKLLDEVRKPSRIEGHDIHISGSVGISLFPDDAEDAESLMKNADMAMYRAKEQGKNTFQVFSADLAARGTAMRVMENALRSAVVRSEFELYLQPKVALASGKVIGAEALLRWHHPTRGLISPAEFMPLAEETGLIHEIGDWVIDAACVTLRHWQSSGLGDLTLAVNLAAGQFRASQLAPRVKERVLRERCDPRFLELEITETGMLRDPEGVGRTLAELREFGVRVAIDDFGTGYSSLSHLKRFPIDTLKVDKTFVAGIDVDRGDHAIVAAVIALARALEITAVAEGVETEAQLASLRELGCDAYQGFLFSRPVRAPEFEAIAKRATG